MINKSGVDISKSLSEQANALQPQEPRPDSWTEVRAKYHSKSQPRSQVQSGPNEHPQRQAGTSSNVRPKLRISLTKGPDGGWSPSVNSSQNRHGPTSTSVPVIVNNEINQPLAATVAENVTSFLSGIRATFRNDNTIVVSKHKSKKPSQSPSND